MLLFAQSLQVVEEARDVAVQAEEAKLKAAHPIRYVIANIQYRNHRAYSTVHQLSVWSAIGFT
jgi:hypothetical protein